MPDTGVRGGVIKFRVNGADYAAKGAFDYDLGKPKLEAIIGADGVHGPKSTPKVAYIEGKITDAFGLDLAEIATLRNATVILELANGKSIVLREAWQAGDAKGNTEEGEIDVRFESEFEAEEVR